MEIFDFLALIINNKKSFFDDVTSCSFGFLNIIRYLGHIGT